MTQKVFVKLQILLRHKTSKPTLFVREEEKVIKKQNVEAREAILELERQLSEKEEKQKREVDNIKAREEAEIQKVREEERLKSQSVRISTEESLAVQEENKQRQIIIAEKNKERTDAIERERVEKDRALEQTERERIVTLAEIEKQRVIEIERKSIQDVIRERVELEKGVVEEQQNVKDIEAFREIDRQKQVGLTEAALAAEQKLIENVKAAESAKKVAEEHALQRVIDAEGEKNAAKQKAEEMIIEAEARKEASEKEAEARKTIADAKAKEDATHGLAEAEVIKAKAIALEKQGLAEAIVIEKQGLAEAMVIEKQADAKKIEGLMEAEIIKQKALAEATGIEEKANAMKKLDGVGKEHEEFKLHLQKEKEVELAQIKIQKDIAEAQASVLAQALKSANIDIVGGETMFFDNIVKQITHAKGFDRLINESSNATEIKNALLGDGKSAGNLMDRIKYFAEKTGISTEDIKNLSIAGLILKMQSKTTDSADKGFLTELLNMAKSLGIASNKIQ